MLALTVNDGDARGVDAVEVRENEGNGLANTDELTKLAKVVVAKALVVVNKLVVSGKDNDAADVVLRRDAEGSGLAKERDAKLEIVVLEKTWVADVTADADDLVVVSTAELEGTGLKKLKEVEGNADMLREEAEKNEAEGEAVGVDDNVESVALTEAVDGRMDDTLTVDDREKPKVALGWMVVELCKELAKLVDTTEESGKDTVIEG
eukprot:m.223267 g.223267  ORF g.223267 m.223267 type:complete len:207 (-) comp26343_c0_seq2:951-1571(-)